MEPTANAIEVGCLGNLNARITRATDARRTARGRGSGDNAIHAAIERARADRRPRRSERRRVDGLVFREVVSVTTIDGGIAGNVVPDLVEAHVNFRYAPTRARDEAEARLRELLGIHGVEFKVIGNAPPGPVVARQPARGRGSAPRRDLEVRPEAGVDARGGVRDDRRGRGQLRAGRPAVRSSRRRAGRPAIALVRATRSCCGGSWPAEREA